MEGLKSWEFKTPLCHGNILGESLYLTSVTALLWAWKGGGKTDPQDPLRKDETILKNKKKINDKGESEKQGPQSGREKFNMYHFAPGQVIVFLFWVLGQWNLFCSRLFLCL